MSKSLHVSYTFIKLQKQENVRRGGTWRVHSRCLIDAYVFTRILRQEQAGAWGCGNMGRESRCIFIHATLSRLSSALDTGRRKWERRQGADPQGLGGAWGTGGCLLLLIHLLHAYHGARSWAGTRKAPMGKIRKQGLRRDGEPAQGPASG